jgi:hypothetical protein
MLVQQKPIRKLHIKSRKRTAVLEAVTERLEGGGAVGQRATW